MDAAPRAPDPPAPPVGWQLRVWRRDLLGALVAIGALVAGEGVFVWANRQPGHQPLVTVGLLLASALLALLAGTLALAAGPRVGLGTIRRKMAFSASVGTLFAFGDALLTARFMFVAARDVGLLLMLLLFSLLISLTLVLSLAGTMGRAIAALVGAARRLATGHLDTVVPVEGGDELALLAADLGRLAVRLTASQEAQRALEAARRDLVVGISHDLRTPLNAAQTVASALADGVVGPGTDEAIPYLHALEAQLARMAALVDDLFALARLEGPEPRLVRAPYPTGDLVLDLLTRAAPLARAAGVRLDGEVDPATPAALVDARQVERVLDNLIQNALDHTPAGGVIVVRAAPHDAAPPAAHVSVCDTGTGVPADDLPLLFDRYHRRRAGGTGLGLAIVKAVAQAHGGHVRATSPPHGQPTGTCINLTLPAVPDPAAGAGDADVAP